jgi:hypothetical protein
MGNFSNFLSFPKSVSKSFQPLAISFQPNTIDSCMNNGTKIGIPQTPSPLSSPPHSGERGG